MIKIIEMASFLKNKLKIALITSAMASTAIAGILHILMVPRSMENEVMEGIFFLISGILQIFWILPILKDWNKIWYYIGIVGSGVLFALWLTERIPRLASGGGIRLSGNTIAIEVFQISFIVLCIVLVQMKSKDKKIQKITRI